MKPVAVTSAFQQGADLPGATARLERAGIIAAVRGGLPRTSWHLYNDECDVDAVLEVLMS